MKYACIVADPPWPQKGAGALKGSEGFVDATGASNPMPYPTMTLEAIKALPIAGLVAPDAYLFLWTTNGFLPVAFGVLEAWGFRYSTTLVWAKQTMGGGLGGPFGIATEFVLLGRRGSPKPRSKFPCTWFTWPRPYDERGKPKHSAKPPQLWDIVQQVCDGPYLELFAREPRMGVDSWGPHADLNHVGLATDS